MEENKFFEIVSKLTHLKEIGTVCEKNDGWQMIIEVHSEDRGILFDKTNPARAHIKDIDGNYLGKFAITREKPRSGEYVFDCDKKHIIPSEYKQKIADWAPKPSSKYDEEDGIATNWGATKAEWRNLHSEDDRLINMNMEEAKQLCSGIFWILSDCYDLSDYELLMFNIPCDPDGNPNNTHSIALNSKSGNTYNHKKLWESEVKNNSKYRPYNKKSYDYYPRGRIEISNNRAVIYLNPHINKPDFIDIIKQNFGLFPCNISEVRIIADGSDHYQCFLDRG